MEEMYGSPSGPQFYVLSEEGYRELKSIQQMLSLMAGIAYNEDDDKNGNDLLTLRREEFFFVFTEISAQIGDALDRVGNENGLSHQSRIWQ